MPSPTLNISGYYTAFLNREAVTLYDNLGVGLGTVADAKRLGPNVREQAPAGGNYLGTRCTWKIPSSQAPVGKELKPGFLIVDQYGIAYVIQRTNAPGPLLQNVWRLTCLALRALNSTLQLKQPTDSTDEFASPITTQNNFSTPVAAAIQEEENEYLENFQGKQGYRRHFKAWVMLQQPFLPQGAVIVDNNKVQYTVGEVHNRTRIDELTQIDLFIDP